MNKSSQITDKIKITTECFNAFNDILFKPKKLSISNFCIENESIDYGAFTCKINDINIIFRIAKITPNKKGQFVTLWKRNSINIIEPLDDNDVFQLVLISVYQNEKSGIFIFPKSILIEKGIVKTNKQEGKRAFRIYPNWDKNLNQQALKTQKWQLDYFIQIPNTKNLDISNNKLLDYFNANI